MSGKLLYFDMIFRNTQVWQSARMGVCVYQVRWMTRVARACKA